MFEKTKVTFSESEVSEKIKVPILWNYFWSVVPMR